MLSTTRTLTRPPSGSPRAARGPRRSSRAGRRGRSRGRRRSRGARPRAPAANTTASSAFSGSVPAKRTPSSADRDEVGSRPGRDPPGVRPAEAGVPVLRGRPQQRGGGVVAALPACQALVQLDGASLLEEVDHGVGVAAERQRGARLREPGASGRCRRPGRARWSGRRSSRRRRRRAAPRRASSRWVACTAVKRAASAPASASTAVGVRSVGVQAGAVLGRLLGHVGVQRAVPLRRPAGHDRGGGRGRPRARCGWPPRFAPTPRPGARRRAPPRPPRSPSEKRRWAPAGGSPIPPCR